MKTSLVRIGNSRGIRIPKAIIEQCGFRDRLEMTVRGRTLVVAGARRARQGWEEAFARGAPAGEDETLMPDALATSWDEAEWRW